MTRVKSGPKKPEYEPRTVKERLGYLVEECGEVLQAAGKSLRRGLNAVNPELAASKQETNRVWLHRELGDLKVAILKVEKILGPTVSDSGGKSERERCLPFCELIFPHPNSPCMNFDPASRVDDHAAGWTYHGTKNRKTSRKAKP